MEKKAWNWGLVLQRSGAQHLIRGRGGEQAVVLSGLSRQCLGKAVGGFQRNSNNDVGVTVPTDSSTAMW